MMIVEILYTLALTCYILPQLGNYELTGRRLLNRVYWNINGY